MKHVSCLVVDDEPIARDIIQNYCSHLPSLNVIACCVNALEAKNILERQSIDILFLDIHMPVLDGMAFVKTLKTIPQLIFTTAYKEYAANAFDLAACDYLVKPFSLDRFIIAVDKAIQNLESMTKSEKETVGNTDHLFIRTDGKIHKVLYDDILYAEAKGNYTSVITHSATYLPPVSFTAFEEMLPPDIFVRIHRSFIINAGKISHIEGNTASIGQFSLPIGSIYKEIFMKKIGL